MQNLGVRDQSHRITRLLKIAALALVGLLGAYSPWSNAGAGQTDRPQQPVNRVEIVGEQIPMDQRTGSDDGAVFAVHFSGETHGVLEPCG
jgi:hypothetical protein